MNNPFLSTICCFTKNIRHKFFSFHQDLKYILFCSFFFIFIAGFYTFPQGKLLLPFYYYGVIPLLFLNYQQIDFKGLFQQKWFYFVLIYLLYCAFSNLWLTPPSVTLMYRMLRKVFYLLSFFLSIQVFLILPTKTLLRALTGIFVISSISAVISILVWYSSHPLSERLWGFFYATHPILAVWAYGTTLLYGFYQFLITPSLRKAILYFMGCIPLLAFALLTQSRGPVIALAVAVLYLIFSVNNKRAWFCLFIGILAVCIDIPMLSRSGITVLFRLSIWKTVIQNSLSHFWFGHGYSSIRTVHTYDQDFSHAHNALVEMFYLGGIVGTLMLIGLMILPFLRIWQLRKHPVFMFIIANLLFGIVCFMTDGSKLVTGPHLFWLSFWLPWILSFYLSDKKLAITHVPS
jgi:hypothetical protein